MIDEIKLGTKMVNQLVVVVKLLSTLMIFSREDY